MHDIYAQDVLCQQPNPHTYELRVVIPGSAEVLKKKKKYRENGNEISQSKEPSVEQLTVLCVFLWSAKC